VGHVAQAEGDGDDVEMAIGKRQVFGVADGGGQQHAGIDQAGAALTQHGFVDVGVHHLAGGTDLGREGQAEVAGAAGDVEHAIARLRVGHGDGVVFPGPVQARRHQVVHDVVARRHRVEHAAHVRGLVALIDGLEAEMGGGHRCRW